MNGPLGAAGRVARAFITNKLTPILLLGSILAGVIAVTILPREEEPQIIVPMIDIFVGMPGARSKEVEERVVKPMEKLLWEIKGVEYIYSTSMPGQGMVTVRFYVGQDEEDSLVKVYHKLFSHLDMMPPGTTMPLVRLRTIYDVPVLALTIWGKGYDSFELRRIASQFLCDKIRSVREVNEAKIIGGRRRQIRVVLNPAALAAHNVSAGMVYQVLQSANQEITAGDLQEGNQELWVRAGGWLTSAEDVGAVVVGAYRGKPVYLRDVAQVVDGPEEPADYVFFGPGPARAKKHGWAIPTSARPGEQYPAVTIMVAKHRAANAIHVVNHVLAKVRELQRTVLPKDLHITITRNYGETATEKSNELLEHMLIAIFAVVLLMGLVMGWREGVIVAIAVPVTLSLTLLVLACMGYTLNRVTLFALVFSIGILVDDAIVVVENVIRHYQRPSRKPRNLIEIAVRAVDEVGNPTILATLAVIFAILPMAMVRGLMGPYMRPIPVGATAAMMFSLAVALMITPWATYKLFKGETGPHAAKPEGRFSVIYRRGMQAVLTRPGKRALFLGMVVLALLAVVAMLPLKLVRVKMLPFDNKSEFQIIINAPEGYPLERTAQAAREIGDYIATVPEVTDYEVYVGTASPYNFNGLVRHYYLRRGPNVADLQVNLVGKHERKDKSHAIAKRVRPGVQKIGDKYGVQVTVAEVPPGPPVLQTLVAEVYGPDYDKQIEVARQVEDIFRHTPGVVDVDDYIEERPTEYQFVVDKEKAALNGVTTEQVANTLAMATRGLPAGIAHIPTEREPCDILLRLPQRLRTNVSDLLSLKVMSREGRLIPLSELIKVEPGRRDRNIYRKNLREVVYVVGDVAGAEESPIYAILKMFRKIGKIHTPDGRTLAQVSTHVPFYTDRYVMKWDGEWQVSYEVFRDLGMLFGVVLLLIYALMVGWFQSFTTPIAIMAVIPLSLIGILPAHSALGAFFTATSMIGFIAGAGIVVRNSIILVDFIELRLKEGMTLTDACIDAGIVRFRPIFLTAAAVFVGVTVILFDPIFQGMAVSLMAGEAAAVFFTPVVVPILYSMIHKRSGGPAAPEGASLAAGESAPRENADDSREEQ